MKCAREGCENELPADHGPRLRFCDDRECRRVRRMAVKASHRARYTGRTKEVLLSARPCAFEGCSNTFVPLRTDQRYCRDIDCFKARDRHNQAERNRQKQEARQEQLRTLLFSSVPEVVGPAQQSVTPPPADSLRTSVQAALDAAQIRLIETQAVIQALTQLLHPQEMLVMSTDSMLAQRVEVH